MLDNPATIVNLSTTIPNSMSTAVTPKSFAAVATDARASLDAAYTAAGQTFSSRTHSDDWKTAFEGMDRRSMFAIASNEGGGFSETERKVAQYFMAVQQSEAKNPAGLPESNAAGLKAGIAFWDSVSSEEKATFQWAQQRASMQSLYEVLSRQEGNEPENLDSPDPIVKMIKAAMDSLLGTTDTSVKLEDTAGFKQAEALSKARSEANSSKLIDRLA